MSSAEPTVVVILKPSGLERAFVLFEEDNVDALEAGNSILASISFELALIDNKLRQEKSKTGDPESSGVAV